MKEAQRASWKAYVSSINARTPLTDVFNKLRRIAGKYSAPPPAHRFCCRLGERWQTLELSPTFSQSTLIVFPGGILYPRAHVTAREWNLSA
ncbi:hypothetical protein E2C01_082960 [Portunus trituberculatus]|uniref:Uncharacterized protein n=1 Tax=Portunus trituberculatus TaxID=210409 RepID=A0A5B7ITM9_PORTR|nr:hypothetical protein [Portunus trituberculatus]